MRIQRKLQFATAFLSLAAASLAVPGAGHAAPAARESAQASFVSQDRTGCVMTEVSVFVRGAPSDRARLRLSVLQVDECRDVALLNIQKRATLDSGAFRMAPELGGASLRASIPVRDRQSRQRFTADIRVTWQATEPAISAAGAEELLEPGRFQAMRRPAERTLRMSEASATIRTGSETLRLGSTEDAWLARSVGGVAVGAQAE